MYKALDASPIDARKAQAAGQKAIAYAPDKVGLHINVAFLDYLAGDKQASLDEFTKARTLNPTGFNKSFKEESDFAPFKPILADKDFLLKLFPAGLPQ
jgi:hypothetical protein